MASVAAVVRNGQAALALLGSTLGALEPVLSVVVGQGWSHGLAWMEGEVPYGVFLGASEGFPFSNW